jgi:hypothetical protein
VGDASESEGEPESTVEDRLKDYYLDQFLAAQLAACGTDGISDSTTSVRNDVTRERVVCPSVSATQSDPSRRLQVAHPVRGSDLRPRQERIRQERVYDDADPATWDMFWRPCAKVLLPFFGLPLTGEPIVSDDNFEELGLPAGGWKEGGDIAASIAMRASFEAHMPTEGCACCSCNCPPRDVEVVPFDAALFSPLRRDGVVSPELPRDAHTLVEIDGVEYCMQGDPHFGAFAEPSAGAAASAPPCPPPERPSGVPPVFSGRVHVTLCVTCADDLRQQKVPPWSLVRVDYGEVPEELRRLGVPTWVEKALINPVKGMRKVVLMRPTGRPDDPADTYQRGLRSHVSCVPNPEPHMSVIFAIPHPVDSLPAEIQASGNSSCMCLLTCVSKRPRLTISHSICRSCSARPSPRMRSSPPCCGLAPCSRFAARWWKGGCGT